MARIQGSVLLGFALPVALLAINLIWGYGGIIATIGLFVWIGLALMIVPAEEEG